MIHVQPLQLLISLFLKAFLLIYGYFPIDVKKMDSYLDRNITSKDILSAIHEHNMQQNLSMIQKEANIFGVLFIDDGATIYRIPLLNILV